MDRDYTKLQTLVSGKMTFPTKVFSLGGIEKVRSPNMLDFPTNLTKDTPFTNDLSLTERPGYLRLYGGPYNLRVPACPTLFLRKQTHRFCTWQTSLSFHPTSEHVEAGTVLWWNSFTKSRIGIRKTGNGHIVRFQSSDCVVEQRELKSTTEVVLFIECKERYRFGYRESSDTDICWLGEVEAHTATEAPPVGAQFTGMMLGVYCYGQRNACLTPADFSYAQFA